MDIRVKVHIIEARELKGRNKNGMSDPVASCTVFGRRQHTSVHKNTVNCVWDHPMFFDFRKSEEEFKTGNIIVTVDDANTIMRNEMIGQFAFELERVYGQPNHEYYRQWVPLFSPDHGSDIQGALKVSVTVLKPGDTDPYHDPDADEEDGDGGDLQSMMMNAPDLAAAITGYQLFVRVYRAEDLPKMDSFGKCDGFALVQFGSNRPIKSKVVKNAFNPVWNEELRIPVYTPCMSDKIELRLYDWDRGGSDELIATQFFKFSEIVQEPFGPAWVNMYGAPEDQGFGSKFKSLMSGGRMEPTDYKGRMLVQLEAELNAGPKLMKSNCGRASDPISDEYILRFDLFEATEVPAEWLEKVFVCVSMGKHRRRSKVVACADGVASWYQPLKELKMTFPRDMRQLPDVLVELYIKSKLGKEHRVGYLKYPAIDVLGMKNPIEWHLMNPDKMSPAIDGAESVAGQVQFRLCFGTEKDAMRTVRPKMEKPLMRKYELRAYLYQGKNLPGADDNGMADPYAVVRLAGATVKSERIDKTLYPNWYAALVMDVVLPQPLTLAPDITVDIYDHDAFGSDDFLGRFRVVTGTIKNKMPKRPTWHPIYYDSPAQPDGEVLASFQIVPKEDVRSFPLPKSIVPVQKACILEIVCVGLRSMVPHNLLMGLQNPFIEFQVDAGKANSFIRQTEPCNFPTGTNPNHLSMMNMEISLPEEGLFAPTLVVRVYDKIMGITSLVASVSVDLNPYLPWTSAVPTRNNLPPAVTEIPGAADGDEAESDTSSIYSIEAPVDHVPLEIAEVNEEVGEALIFYRPTSEADTKRTIPDVEDTMIGDEESDDDVEEEKLNKPVPHELELDLNDLPFDEFDLWKGKKRGMSWLDKMMKGDKPNTLTKAGRLKGNFRVIPKSDVNSSPPKPLSWLKEQFKPQMLMVRVYVIRGINIVPKDAGNTSDPYLVLELGDSKVDDHEYKCEKTLAPQFYRSHELVWEVPGEAELTISVYDEDIFQDELIGVTKIDLENRWFSDEWRAMVPKPREIRTLWSPISTSPQGQIEMYLEILTEEEAKKTPMVDLVPPGAEPFEVRCIVWETRGVVGKDTSMFSGKDAEPKGSDIYVSCTLECYEEKDASDEARTKMQKTDVHWNSEDGTGKFNWRMVWGAVYLPPKKKEFTRLRVQLWDQNYISANEAIGEVNMNLKAVFKKAVATKKAQSIARGWFPLLHPNAEGTQGEVEMSIEVMPEKDAADQKAGLGRDPPNALPKPERPENFNPLLRPDKAFKSALKKNKKYLYYAAGAFCCVMVGPALIPIMLRTALA